MSAVQRIKRVIDVVIATAVLILAAPLLAVTALLVLLLEGRPVFYISRRHTGRDRAIPVIKFRTMVRDAMSPAYRLNERFMRHGYLDIPRTCEVYTPIGRILERTQLVELPQMLNVLIHGMSLIGNRPLPAANVQLLKRFPNWGGRFDSPAGISGVAQVVGKLWLDPKDRLALEVGYSRLYQTGNVIRCDLLILFYTARVILTGRGLQPERAFEVLGLRPAKKAAAGSAEVSGA